MGTAAKLAEPYVVALLTDIDQNMRLNAFHTLVALGVDPRPGLKKALEHKDLATRIKTAVTMTELNLELELDASLVAEPQKLQERIRDLFDLVRTSLAEELNGHGAVNDG